MDLGEGGIMEALETSTVETTINELIAALREGTARSAENEREQQILVAYMLSGLFGTDGLCSRSWH